ncbi:hypothetical protein E2I00_004920, partial [Balaenoptera physalus]
AWRPDLDDPLTLHWQLGPRYAALQFTRTGAASRVAFLRPLRKQLHTPPAEGREWYPSLGAKRESLRLMEERMAKMPQRSENRQRQQQERREKEELQAEAQERLGYHQCKQISEILH